MTLAPEPAVRKFVIAANRPAFESWCYENGFTPDPRSKLVTAVYEPDGLRGRTGELIVHSMPSRGYPEEWQYAISSFQERTG